MFDSKKLTGVCIGRYQGCHQGHVELFKTAIEKYGQLCIMIRDTQGTTEKDPFDFEFCKNEIIKMMEKENFIYGEKYIIIQIPNCASVIYGRDVGYKIEKIELSDELQKISATKLREELLSKNNK